MGHRDDTEHIHLEDDFTPTLPVISEISETNILPEGRRRASNHPNMDQTKATVLQLYLKNLVLARKQPLL